MSDIIWAVIAAKNEEKHIAKVIRDTKKHVDKIVIVDDGSTDNTNEIATKSGAIVLTHLVNLGKGAAIKTGCEYARDNKADIIVLLDADHQHEPKDIPKLITSLKKSQIVFGVRKKRKNMPLVLKFGNWFINSVTRTLYGVKIVDTQCGFRVFRAKIYPLLKWRSSNYSLESEMIANVGKKRLKYTQVPISTIYSDKYKGTTIIDGVKIVGNLLWWKISR